jgi:lysophospholipase L1-like esterase
MGKKPGGIVLAALAGTGILLFIQGILARKQLGNQLKEYDAETFDMKQSDRLINFVVIGDSLGVGMGADSYHETPGVLVAKSLAANLNCYITYNNFAVSGAATSELHSQTLRAVETKPDIALIIIGTNDVTGLRCKKNGLEHLTRSILLLQAAGAQVFLVPCVDLSIVTAIGNPLRSLLGKMAKSYALHQRQIAERLGAIVIDYQPITSKFVTRQMFSLDNYHPSSEGYIIIAEHIEFVIREHYRPDFG